MSYPVTPVILSSSCPSISTFTFTAFSDYRADTALEVGLLVIRLSSEFGFEGSSSFLHEFLD
jgi:hypothetical protein